MNLITAIVDYYKRNNEKYGKGHLKNLWADETRQNIRFEKIIELVKFDNESIYNVSCGHC